MKIVQGSLKGKNIVCPLGVRPVSSRVKRACFDILRGEVRGRRVLDLFAGSGSLGIEALSLGAAGAVFIDLKRRCVKTIKKNLTLLRLTSKSAVYLKDAFKKIKELHRKKEPFDLIFLDPPYYKGILKKSLQTLGEYDILATSAYIVSFCYAKDDSLKTSKIFSLILSKKYGQTLLLIYKKCE